MRRWGRTPARVPAGNAGDSVSALSALYQAERQDASNITLAALALIAGALTYLGIAALLLNDAELPGGAWAASFLAFPLWVVTSFHVVLVGSSLKRAISAEIIEAHLMKCTGFNEEDHRKIGIQAARPVMNVGRQPIVLRVQTFICYGGVGTVIIAFSAACLAVAAKKESWVSAPVFAAGGVYILLLVAAVSAWLHVLRFANEITSKASGE